MGFRESSDVRNIAEKIIKQHHEHLVEAMEKNLIGYYMRDGNGIDWAGKAKKCTAFERATTDYMLFVFINEDAWRVLDSKQKVALVDHELCHFQRKSERMPDPENGGWKTVFFPATDPDSWYIRDHDVEEFSEIIERHGLWEQGIENFAKSVRKADYQMSLFEEENGHIRAVK